MSKTDVIAMLQPAIAAAASKAVNASRGLAIGDRHQITQDVIDAIAPVVINQTNQEPWYQSRVTWGAIIAVVGGVAGAVGYTLSPDDQLTLVNSTVGIVQGVASIVATIGGLLAWYGRWRAAKPIGQ